MKKILILSDTHSCFDTFIEKHAHDVDEIWHAGDIGSEIVFDSLNQLAPIKAVYGNIDNQNIRFKTQLDLLFECEKTKIFMTHIGGYPGKYENRILKTLQNNAINIFISGHSHILKVIYDKKYNFLHINPGAAGKNGFHQIRTMIKLDISEHEIKNLRIIEIAR